MTSQNFHVVPVFTIIIGQNVFVYLFLLIMQWRFQKGNPCSELARIRFSIEEKQEMLPL